MTQIATVTPELTQALKAINWNYGRGDIVTITLNPQGTGGEVVCQKQYGADVNRFTLLDGKVRYRGRTRKI